MKRILIIAAAAAALAGPALAQSTQSTTGSPAAAPIPPAGTRAPDQMGAAATTGDTTAQPGTMGTDSMSTSSTTGGNMGTSGNMGTMGATGGTEVPTQGMDPNSAAAASQSTPSGGIVPGQTPE